MKIGIIGIGSMGRALGLRWAQGGHHVLFGSRDRDKADAAAAEAGGGAEAGDFDAAAAFGEVVLYTVRDVLPSRLLRGAQPLAGKVVIDCTNSGILGVEVPDPEHRSGAHFSTPIPARAERLAADVAEAHVVKAFNTVPAQVIALPRAALAPHGVSVLLCGDDAAAKAVVKSLAEDIGFVGVDCGGLERAQLVEGAADLVRLLIIEMGLGPFATLSVKVLPEE
jgi:predicted dinucleotide-binding enzyme